MPLVQSLDILRRRVTNPLFKSVLDDVYERVRGGNSLSEAFEAHGTLFPGVYTASLLAGEKSGNLEQVIRRYVAYVKGGGDGQTEDDLGAGLSGDPDGAVARRRLDHRAAGGAGVRRVLRAVRSASCRCRRGSSCRCPSSRAAYFLLIVGGAGGRGGDVLGLDQGAGAARAVRSLDAAAADARADRAEVLDLAGGADAGDAARRRHPARQCHRHLGALDQEPLHRARAAARPGSRCAKGGRWPPR